MYQYSGQKQDYERKIATPKTQRYRLRMIAFFMGLFGVIPCSFANYPCTGPLDDVRGIGYV
jgi:hypothetical protein